MSITGVLPHQEILGLIPGTIVGGDQKCVRTASYDMRVGDEYYLHDPQCPDGQAMRKRNGGGIVIPPNGLLMCTMLETLKLPKDMIGHLSLKVALLMKGVMMASQSQIDAGYQGSVFGMLYNLSQRDVCLREGDFVLRLELTRLAQETTKPYDNTISSTATLKRYIDAPLISSLVQIRQDAAAAVKEVKEAKDSLSVTQLGGTIVLGVITLFCGLHFASDTKVDDLTQKVHALETTSKVSEATALLKTRVDELEKQNSALQARLDVAGLKGVPDASRGRSPQGEQAQPGSAGRARAVPTEETTPLPTPVPAPQR